MKVSVETAKIVRGQSAVELNIRLEGVHVLPFPPIPLGEPIKAEVVESSTPGYVILRINPSDAVLLWTRYYISDNGPPPMPTKTATPYEDTAGTMAGPMNGSAGAACEQTVALGPNQCILLLAWGMYPNNATLDLSTAGLCHSSSSSSSSLASSSSSSPSPGPLSSSSLSSSSPSPAPSSSSKSSSSSSSRAAQSSSSSHL